MQHFNSEIPHEFKSSNVPFSFQTIVQKRVRKCPRVYPYAHDVIRTQSMQRYQKEGQLKKPNVNQA